VERPLLRDIGPRHQVACHFPEPVDEPEGAASTPSAAAQYAKP
jgi:hypothetical protein